MKPFYSFLLLILLGGSLIAQPKSLRFQRLKSMPKGKYNMAFASDGEIFYLIGGSGHRKDLSDDIFTYYAKYKIWLKLRTEHKLEPQKMATAVYYPPLQRIYVFGGVGELEPKRSAVRYVEYLLPNIRYIDVNTKRWEIGSENPHPGANIGVTTWKEKMYLFGGSVGTEDPSMSFQYLDTVHEFDPRTSTWKELPGLPYAMETQGCIIDGVLYTFAGFNGGSFQEIYALDLEVLQWKKVSSFPYALSGHVVVPWKRYAIIIGDKRRLNYLAVYDTVSGAIKEFKTNIKGHSRGACIIDGKLYVAGGLLFTEKNSTRETLFELDLEVLEKKLAGINK